MHWYFEYFKLYAQTVLMQKAKMAKLVSGNDMYEACAL